MSDSNVSRETILESNLSVFSEICLSLDKLYSYLNHCQSRANDDIVKEEVGAFLKAAKSLYIFSSATMDMVKSELDKLDSNGD